MLSLGALAFAAPWILGALAALPILWWLLKLTPPAARLTHFPAVRFLLNIPQDEETPARTPLWLVILRFSLAALIILALAHPILNPSSRLGGSGPLLLVVDNGWAAAQHWQARQHMMADLIDQAERAERSVILLATAPPASGEPIHPTSVMRASAARRATQFLRPQPWPTDHEAAVRAVAELAAQGSVNVWWLSDGLAGRVDGGAGRAAPAASVASHSFGTGRPALPGCYFRRSPKGRTSAFAPGAPKWARRTRCSLPPGLPMVAYCSANHSDSKRRNPNVERRVSMPSEIRNKIVRVDVPARPVPERWPSSMSVGGCDRSALSLSELRIATSHYSASFTTWSAPCTHSARYALGRSTICWSEIWRS